MSDTVKEEALPIKLEEVDYLRLQNLHLRLMNINGQMRLMEIELQKAMQERVKAAKEFDEMATAYEHKYGVDIRKKSIGPDGMVIDAPPAPGT